MKVHIRSEYLIFAILFGIAMPQEQFEEVPEYDERDEYFDEDLESRRVERGCRTIRCADDINWQIKPFKPLRVKFFEVNLTAFSAERKRFILKLIKESVDYFQQMFLVRRSNYALSMTRDQANSCDTGNGDLISVHGLQYHIQEKPCHTDPANGIHDADFVIYLRLHRDCKPGSSILASALNCDEVISFDGRPIFGRVSLCPYSLNTEQWNYHSLSRTLQHEIMHAMGFNAYEFRGVKFMENGNETLAYIRKTRTWKVNDRFNTSHNVSLLISPKVKSFARYHFNCSTLEGGELEMEGKDGTSDHHWDKRVFGGETMSGYSTRRSYLSELTMAFFEDSSWYKINYRRADPLTRGKNLGCTFAERSCREYLDEVGDKPGAAKPYCNWGDYIENKRLKSTVRECSTDHEYYSYCGFGESDSVSDDHNYFADKWTVVDGKNYSGHRVHGWEWGMDGCPQWTEITGGKYKVGDSVCTNKYGQPLPGGNWGAEIFSENSMCIQQEGKFEIFQCLRFGVSLYHTERNAHGAGCYRYTCESGRLMIQANYTDEEDDKRGDFLHMKQYKVCWGEGSVIRIRRHQFSGPNRELRYHKGTLICPSCKKICENNVRFPNFKCFQDIRLNSTDYALVPCEYSVMGQGKVHSSKDSQSAVQKAAVYRIIVMNLYLILIVLCC